MLVTFSWLTGRLKSQSSQVNTTLQIQSEDTGGHQAEDTGS